MKFVSSNRCKNTRYYALRSRLLSLSVWQQFTISPTKLSLLKKCSVDQSLGINASVVHKSVKPFPGS